MRHVIFGAGAVGGVIGARLWQAGKDVALIARGRHLEALRRDGLSVESVEGRVTLPIPAFAGPDEAGIEAGDAVVLAMKTQDTDAALDALAAHGAADVAVVCAQNGVENERLAARRFERVYGVMVVLPATHLEPGVVFQESWPTPGVLEVGRYPQGEDDTSRAIAADLCAAGFSARSVADVMRWKYAKLLSNLGNALQALCGESEADGLRALAVKEALACYRAAGIDWASDAEMTARREGQVRLALPPGHARAGGSSWQSLARGAGMIETDYLNGEVALLGRLHGVATPVNALLQSLCARAVREAWPPGRLRPADILALLERPSGSDGA